ncbi:Tad domain-containing protein [Sporomusa sp.]|uniref:Tad domain-containing protein n=1 Tax=Sporomusa sp. TaxID=2078658 RepID=UPI002CC24107|nr:Tad domain-containing protein [Sporomusa sp.]HWR44655.1 Tad domain-containing protein [Sporomusa sp.]
MRIFVNNQKGTITVLTACAITALIGFTALVVDVGFLYVNRAELVNIADAAALAGVQDLPNDTAHAEASGREYGARNSHPGDVVEVAVPTNKVVTATAKRTVNMTFAKILGLNAVDVRAEAAAVIRPTSGVIGVVPFGVVWQEFIYGQTYALKVGAGDGYAGNYDALALGGTGSRNYTDNIKLGYDAKLSVGQWVSTETGNMSGGTSEGVNYRIGLDPYATFNTVEIGSPRIVIVPLIESITNDTGRHDVKIVGFAGFFLEGVAGSGKDNLVSGKFMQTVVAGESSGTATDYGVYSAALVPYESVAPN